MRRTLENTLDFLRRLMPPTASDGTSDAALAARWADGHDEEAFAQLLQRHGPMVFGVCRRILRDEHRSEEAFQATFLVLAARGAALRNRESVAAWLHGIAVRVATKAAERTRREAARHDPVEPDTLPAASASPNDFGEALERELAALPEEYRAAVLLCDVQGQSPPEACRALGWSANQLRGRLHRARSLLRKRLARHGWGDDNPLALPPVPPPLPLQASTLDQAALFVLGAADAPATGLAHGVLQAMRQKIGLRLAAIGLACVLLAGVLTPATPPPLPNEPVAATAAPAPTGAAVGLFRQPAPVQFAAVSPDGKTLALAGTDRAVRWIDLESGQEVGVWKIGVTINGLAYAGDRTVVDSGTVSPEGGFGVGGPGGRGDPQTPHLLRTWDPAREREAAEPVTIEAPGVVYGLSPDGGTVLTQERAAGVLLREPATGKTRTLDLAAPRPTGTINSAAYSADGKRVAAVTYFGNRGGPAGQAQPYTIYVWDTATGKQLFRREFDGSVGRVALSPDGALLAVGVRPGFTVWDVAKAEKKWSVEDSPASYVFALRFDAAGKTLYAGTSIGMIQGYAADDGKPVGPRIRSRGPVVQILALPDGKTLAAVGGDPGYLRLWRPDEARDDYYFPHPGEVTALTVRPDGAELLAAVGKQVHRWALASGKELQPFAAQPRRVAAVAFSPDGLRVALGGDEWDHVHVTDREGKALADWRFKGAGKITALDFSPDGKAVVSAGYLNSPQGYTSGRLTLWDAATGEGRQPFDETKDALTNARFSPDGKRIAATSADGRVLVADLATGKVESRRVGTGASAVVWMPNGKEVVVALDGRPANARRIRAFAIDGWQEVASPGAEMSPARCLAVRPDGAWLAVGCSDGLVHLWEAGSETFRWRIGIHGSACRAVRFLPDGKTIATAGDDGLVRLWDVESGEEKIWP